MKRSTRDNVRPNITNEEAIMLRRLEFLAKLFDTNSGIVLEKLSQLAKMQTSNTAWA